MTSTTNLIRASADIVAVTTLRVGDVYKRLDDRSGSDKLLHGIVTEIHHNGEQAAIVAVEFDSDYFGASVTRKVFATERELALFPSTPDDFRGGLGDIRTSALRRVSESREALAKAEATLREVERALTLIPTPTEFAPATVGATTPTDADEADVVF